MSANRESEAARRSRLRWITLGEAIAVAALVISALGLWHDWRSNGEPEKPAIVVEEPKAIPLVLRGRALDDGRSLEISPIEEDHALESLTVTVPATGATIALGGNERLRARDLEEALGKTAQDGKGTHRLPVRIETRYVEAGADRTARGAYVLSYEWAGGGLFGGRSLRLTGLSRP